MGSCNMTNTLFSNCSLFYTILFLFAGCSWISTNQIKQLQKRGLQEHDADWTEVKDWHPYKQKHCWAETVGWIIGYETRKWEKTGAQKWILIERYAKLKHENCGETARDQFLKWKDTVDNQVWKLQVLDVEKKTLRTKEVDLTGTRETWNIWELKENWIKNV